MTIFKTKTMLFRLAMQYVSCGTSFCMPFKLVSYTYDVLVNLVLLVYSRHKIKNFL